MAGPGARKLPTALSRINRRSSAGSRGSFAENRFSVANVSSHLSRNAMSFFAPGENYFGLGIERFFISYNHPFARNSCVYNEVKNMLDLA